MKANTARGEVEAILRGGGVALTSPEIFEKCKLVGDRKELSTILSQLTTAGRVNRVGEREQDKGMPLALYVPGEVKPKARATHERQPKKTPKAKRPARKAPARKAKRKVSPPPPPQPLEAPGFRCGMFSDGTFAIHCEEGQITLQRAEAVALMAYVGILPTGDAA